MFKVKLIISLLDVFGTRDARASLLTLTSSSGRPTPWVGIHSVLSSLTELHHTADVFRLVPYLLASYVAHMGSHT